MAAGSKTVFDGLDERLQKTVGDSDVFAKWYAEDVSKLREAFLVARSQVELLREVLLRFTERFDVNDESFDDAVVLGIDEHVIEAREALADTSAVEDNLK